MADINGVNVHPTAPQGAERVTKSLTEMINRLDENCVRNFKPNIIKVSADIRKGHEDAYVPKLFFIGPYHHRKKDSRPSSMEQIKLLYLKDLVSRDVENKVSRYVEEVFNNVKRARQQYSDDRVDLDDDAFVEMLVLDGCFIIEFLLKRAEGVIDPPVSDQVSTTPILRRDLLLLENQIPFFILHIILQKSIYNLPKFPKTTKTLLDLSLHYLTKEKITKDMLNEVHRNEDNIYHLLHLSYLCLMEGLSPQPIQQPTPDSTLTQYQSYKKKFVGYISLLIGLLKKLGSVIRYCVSFFIIYFLYCIVHVLVLLFLWRKPSWYASVEKNSKKPRMLPTATELTEAGATFKKKKKKKKKNANCYLDVSFNEKGYFKIPQLSIQDNTNSVFRNFLAFEQSCPQVGNNFTSYVVLMDNLIDTPSDVAILKRRGILESKLGCDDDVAKLFNQMRTGLFFNFEKHYLAGMFERVNGYYNQEHNRWRAKLMHDYFHNPWACFSIIAAVILLFLAAVQTTYTVKSFYDQNHHN